MIQRPRLILVAAYGNRMAGDDAFGPLVAEQLSTRGIANVDVIDLGMKPIALLNHLPGRSALIVVDAALPGPDFPRGTLLDFEYGQRDCPRLVHDTSLSSHRLSLGSELEFAKELELLPATVLIVAAAIENSTIGQPPSGVISRLVPAAANRILELTQQCAGRRKELSHA